MIKFFCYHVVKLGFFLTNKVGAATIGNTICYIVHEK